MPKKKFVLAMMMHETNTFSPLPTPHPTNRSTR